MPCSRERKIEKIAKAEGFDNGKEFLLFLRGQAEKTKEIWTYKSLAGFWGSYFLSPSSISLAMKIYQIPIPRDLRGRKGMPWQAKEEEFRKIFFETGGKLRPLAEYFKVSKVTISSAISKYFPDLKDHLYYKKIRLLNSLLRYLDEFFYLEKRNS